MTDLDLKSNEFFINIINNFSNKHIAVVGDIIVDKFIWGKVSRISPEAPVPVVKVHKEEFMLGGSANVISNITSLEGKVSIFGTLGNDDLGKFAKKTISSKGVIDEGLFFDESRKTSLKTRIIANKQQVVRIDDEDTDPISGEAFEHILSLFKKNKSNFDAIILSDYSKGVVTEAMVDAILENSGKIPVLVDPKVNNFKYYRNVFAITPNASEACTFAQVANEEDRESVIKAAKEILKRLNCANLLVTRSEHGMMLFENEKSFIDIPAKVKEVADVSGAGDTVISVLALGVASGLDMRQSAFISNIASGIVVGKLGTASVKVEELLEAIKNQISG